jgi:LysM repeat protein
VRKHVEDNDTAPSYSRSTLLGREPAYAFPEGVRARPRRLEESTASEFEVYVAVRGDSYWKIARKFSVPIEELLAANGASKSSVLMVGQAVQIPVRRGSAGGEFYAVRQGDSLSLIARERNCTAADLRALNDLSGDLLMVGQQIRVPVTSSSSAQQPTGPSLATGSIGDGKTYIVRRGDTLSLIATACGMDIREIMEINDISDPNRIREGQRLILRKLPTDSGPSAGRVRPVAPAAGAKSQSDVDLLNLFDNDDLFGMVGGAR